MQNKHQRAYKHTITKFLHKQIRPNSDLTKLSSLYNKTIVPGVQLINNRVANIHIRCLRCWVHTQIVGPNKKALCLHCNQNFDPIHYLINCPAFPACRQHLIQLLIPAQHNRFRKSSLHNRDE